MELLRFVLYLKTISILVVFWFYVSSVWSLLSLAEVESFLGFLLLRLWFFFLVMLLIAFNFEVLYFQSRTLELISYSSIFLNVFSHSLLFFEVLWFHSGTRMFRYLGFL